MIVVKVELHSAISGRVTELARMLICNDGKASWQDKGLGTYNVFTGRKSGPTDARSIMSNPIRSAIVTSHRRLNLHVWTLVGKALQALDYIQDPM